MTVHVIATGGTIASHFDGERWTEIDGRTLVDELGDLSREAPPGVDVHDVATGPSSSLSTSDMVDIARRTRAALDDGATGVVVSHGTDVLELTAFTIQLLLGTDAARRPVVVTGAMRPHSHPAPDGPRNLRDAITVAAAPDAAGRDVMVCLDGTLHAAARVVKQSTVTVDAFASVGCAAPLGTVTDGVPRFARPVGSAQQRAAGLDVDVPLLTCYPDLPAAAVERAADGSAGIVLEVFGDLNVPRQLWRAVHAASSSGTLVVLASRPFTPATTNDGLDLLGAIGAGGLTAQKARLATMAALTTHPDRDDATAFVHQYAVTDTEWSVLT